MNFNPETLSDWMMDKEEVESSLSESNEERFAQQTLYLDEPDMDGIQIKVRNQLPISQTVSYTHLTLPTKA